MAADEVPEGVALVRAGWRFRRLTRLLQDLRDAEQTRALEHAAVDERYDQYHADKRREYEALRAGFAGEIEKLNTGAALLPAEIELAGEWLAEIPMPSDPPAGGPDNT